MMMEHRHSSKPYHAQGYGDKCGYAKRLVNDLPTPLPGGMLTMWMSICRIGIYRFGQVWPAYGVNYTGIFREFTMVTRRRWSRVLERKDHSGVATTCFGTTSSR